MLKMNKIELEKINDLDKYIFIEKEMRGGISYINKRYNKGNNEYYSDYDSEKPKTCITYLNINIYLNLNIYHLLVLNGSII